MTFNEWWSENYADSRGAGADYTFGEEVWRAAQRDTWEIVFQQVSDTPQLFPREHIKRLEEARGNAGYGPQ